MHISMAFKGIGIDSNPGYPTYSSVTNLVGAVPIYYNLTESSSWEPDLEALEKLDLSKVKLMWIGYAYQC
jgi:aspartate/methionine/tyrosine aminotransferase